MKKTLHSAVMILVIVLFSTTIFAEEPCTKSDVTKAVEEAVSILEKKQAKGLKEVGEIRFCNGNYVFVNNFKGKTLMHIKRHLIGKVLLGLKDDTGKRFFADFTAMAKSSQESRNGKSVNSGTGWVKYRWPKPGEKAFSQKIAYIAACMMGGQNVYVGAGIYE